MNEHPIMSAAELGALWQTYQKKTMIICYLDYFAKKSHDPKARDLLNSLSQELHKLIREIETLLVNDGAYCPTGFTQEDIDLEAPALFDNGFDILFSRLLKELSMGMYALHLTIAYRQDLIQFYQKATNLTQSYYNQFTDYALEKGYLTRPHYTTMPTAGNYITDKDYTKGTNFMGQKRPINVIEYGILHHAIESNMISMQLLTGFTQCANDQDVQKYFKQGQELAKEMINQNQEILFENQIQAPTSPGGTVTSSTTSPFSDKLMLFTVYMLGSFSMGGVGFQAAFILRHDIIGHTMISGKDAYQFNIKIAKLLMEKGWMEEPPKMEG